MATLHLGLLVLFCFGSIHCQDQNTFFTWDDVNAMDEYVHRDDGWFSWRIISEYRYDNMSVTMYNVNMTSQKWMDYDLVTRPIWYHQLSICVPDDIWYPDAGLLAITGGSNPSDNRPEDPEPQYEVQQVICALAAAEAKAVVGYLRQIPNQRMKFTNDPRGSNRGEDGIIAWTWRTYLDMQVKNPEVILRMPMTKGGKRALDAMTEIAKFKLGLNLSKFAVTGASKRGWTTWSLSAVDKRVVLSLPMVFSLLKLQESAMNHFKALDAQWSWALKDYWEAGLPNEIFSQGLQEVGDYEDMHRYMPRLTMPKLEFASVGDEFFSLTDTHPWWKELPEPKYLLMFANAEHTMAPHYVKLFKSLMGMWHSVMTNTELPTITWDRYETGSYPNRVGHIEVFFKEGFEPVNLIGYHSTLNATKTEGRRDWRMIVASNSPCGRYTDDNYPGCQTEPHLYLWRRNGELIEHSPTHFEFQMPETGVDGEWTGFFIEAQFDGPRAYKLHFTTEVQIVPDTFPGEGCTKDPDCQTNLV